MYVVCQQTLPAASAAVHQVAARRRHSGVVSAQVAKHRATADSKRDQSVITLLHGLEYQSVLELTSLGHQYE
jgi:hypothetical protein